MEERPRTPLSPEPQRKIGDDGPRRPDVSRPDSKRLLERMRRVDPEQAKRYRQRSGE
ncbi:MAG: ubiquitin-like protein UBact [Armatimonadetes bacterium]|nr:ubiquitin-like protein UBact [Armatimonadota bacterium]